VYKGYFAFIRLFLRQDNGRS